MISCVSVICGGQTGGRSVDAFSQKDAYVRSASWHSSNETIVGLAARRRTVLKRWAPRSRLQRRRLVPATAGAAGRVRHQRTASSSRRERHGFVRDGEVFVLRASHARPCAACLSNEPVSAEGHSLCGVAKILRRCLDVTRDSLFRTRVPRNSPECCLTSTSSRPRGGRRVEA